VRTFKARWCARRTLRFAFYDTLLPGGETIFLRLATFYLWPLVPGSGTIYALMPGMLAGWIVYGIGVLILRNQEGASSK